MRVAILVVAMALLTSESPAAVLRVPAPYGSIQGAANAAVSGDTILVAPGTYYEHVVAPHGISLFSDLGAAVTILDGQENGRVLQADGIYLRGFTIQRGLVYEIGGGGIRGSGTIEDCVFAGNATAPYNDLRGGAVYGQFWIRESEFVSNAAQESGGAVYGAVRIEHCTFRNNGARAGWGGAVHGGECFDSYFEANSAHSGAAALYDTRAEGCVFGPHGGGNGVVRTAGTLRRCVFFGQTNTHVIYDAGGAGTLLENCTFVDNKVVLGVYDSGNATAVRCVFVGNLDVVSRGNSATVSISCSVFWNNGDSSDVGQNHEGDPRFCDALSNDYHVSSGSPCLPGHSDGCGLIGALDLACGFVSVRSQTWGAVKSAYR